jgi:choline dehydrogenase-like flavoprotein
MGISYRHPPKSDVVVVGSGATGGWAAKRLCEAGLKVVLVEAGAVTTDDNIASTPNAEGCRFVPRTPSTEILRRQPTQAQCYACREPHQGWFADDINEPYIQRLPFTWIRMRGLGGRLLAWEGQCYRMSDLDFKAAEHDGYGESWPLSYSDLEPYYDIVEQYLGVSGSRAGLNQIPDGVFSTPSGPNHTLQALRQKIETEFDCAVLPARVARLTCSSDAVSKLKICKVETPNGDMAISTYWPAISDAVATRRLFLMPNSVVSHLSIVGNSATRVHYFDVPSGSHYEVEGRVILLCASTLESTRILLSSGAFNSSGVLGHYLMDHLVGPGASGIALKDWNAEGSGFEQHRIYIPRFRNVDRPSMDGFIRGYGFQGRSFAMNRKVSRLVETRLKTSTVQYINLTAFCECLPRFENMVELDHVVRDIYGHPTLAITSSWSHNELLLARDAEKQAERMLEGAGLAGICLNQPRVSVPGGCIHEIGTARMGNDPRTSVVNALCRSHDIHNVFVTDGSCWVSSGCQNPTLTMMALTVRTCDHIIDLIRRGDL